MISKEQHIKMLEKLSNILKVLPDTKNINEISEITKIPSSTIQRYLNKRDLIMELTGYDIALCDEILQKNQEWLKRAKQEGLKQGGKMSQAMYDYTKDETGKFTGNKKNK